MATMNVTKRNHFVPQFYLEYFADEDGFLWVYDKEGGEPREQQPVNTGVEKNLYTITLENGQKDDSLEKWFARLEGKTKPILDKLINSRARISDEDKRVLAEFMAFLHTRVPRSVEAAAEIGVALAQELGQQLVTDSKRFERLYNDFVRDNGQDGMPPVGEARRLYRKLIEGPLQLNRKVALGTSLKTTDVYIAGFLDLHWSVCDAPSGSPFITSDAPVTSIAIHKDGMAQFGGNLIHPNFQVSFPISPDVALYLSRKPRQARWRVGKKCVRELNRRAAYMAERFVYANLRSDLIVRLVRSFASTRDLGKIDPEEARRVFRERGFLEETR